MCHWQVLRMRKTLSCERRKSSLIDAKLSWGGNAKRLWADWVLPSLSWKSPKPTVGRVQLRMQMQTLVMRARSGVKAP